MTYLYVCQVTGCGRSYASTRKAVIHEMATGHFAFKIVQVDTSP